MHTEGGVKAAEAHGAPVHQSDEVGHSCKTKSTYSRRATK